MCDTVDLRQVLERIWREGLEGNLRKQGLASCVQSRLEHFHKRSVHNHLWQFIPVRDYSSAEGILIMLGITPLSVDLDRDAQRYATITFLERSTILSYIFGPELGMFLVVKEAKRTVSS